MSSSSTAPSTSSWPAGGRSSAQSSRPAPSAAVRASSLRRSNFAWASVNAFSFVACAAPSASSRAAIFSS